MKPCRGIARDCTTLTGATGTFDDVVVVENWSDLEPDVVERKYYAPGIGLVRQDSDTVDADVIELVAHEPGT